MTSVIKALPIVLSIVLAFTLWYLTFIVRPFNFWFMMTFNTVILSAISFLCGGMAFRWKEWNLKNILLGIALAAILYGIFWLGHHILIWLNNITGIMPERAKNLQSIYANREIISPSLIALLLFFPIGFGEEIFWRGYIQRSMEDRWGKPIAFIITTILYTGVHIPTANPVLILASFVCGIYWGGVYSISKSLVPVIVSHMVWDPFIFVIFPIGL
ncbi:MAG: CPBP family intramembrane metalloprotease [Syntrophorhabdaceae bacterium]|nr:CPBP family intramembrane metalloprotease [Syntrophorhabdaceae bacterium]